MTEKDVPYATPVQPQQQQAYQTQQAKPPASGKAIGSLVCAILGLFFLGVVLGPIAICLGVSAQNDIKERPNEVGGQCLATSGLVIGIVGTILSVILIIIVVSNN